MRARKSLVVVVLVALAGCGTSGSSEPDVNPPPPPPPPPPSGSLVVDHRAVQEFARIPDEWLDAARALRIHYAHTSHGSQILSGMAQLQRRDARFAYAVRRDGTEGLPPAQTPPVLRIYDGNPPVADSYITPELYWNSDAAFASTRAVAETGHYDASMWSWCGQQSSNDDATVDRYLARMTALQAEFPAMRFVLFTGHTDGTNTPDTPKTLKYNNARVRAYAAAHDMVVYDFEDIESWSPDGATQYPTTGNPDGACNWCQSWCDAHPADCADLAEMDGCAHTHKLNCVLKAKAYWWMMARLAGWDGQ